MLVWNMNIGARWRGQRDQGLQADCSPWDECGTPHSCVPRPTDLSGGTSAATPLFHRLLWKSWCILPQDLKERNKSAQTPFENAEKNPGHVVCAAAMQQPRKRRQRRYANDGCDYAPVKLILKYEAQTASAECLSIKYIRC